MYILFNNDYETKKRDQYLLDNFIFLPCVGNASNKDIETFCTIVNNFYETHKEKFEK